MMILSSSYLTTSNKKKMMVSNVVLVKEENDQQQTIILDGWMEPIGSWDCCGLTMLGEGDQGLGGIVGEVFTQVCSLSTILPLFLTLFFKHRDRRPPFQLKWRYFTTSKKHCSQGEVQVDLHICSAHQVPCCYCNQLRTKHICWKATNKPLEDEKQTAEP